MTITDSSLTDDQLQIQEMARNFALNEVLPVANRLDPLREDIPMELRDKLAQLGFFGIMIPEEYGGAGMGCLEYCIVTEQLGRAWMSVASMIRSPLRAGFLSDKQKNAYLPRIAAGEFVGAFAMSEPGTGSDVSGLKCRAVRDGDQWVLTGNKYWCTFADGADFILVVARTTPRDQVAAAHHGLSAFIVEKPRGTLPEGVSGAPIPKIGYFGWKTWELSFDGVRVPAANMVGEEGRGFYITANGLEVARAHTAARAVGLAMGAVEDAIGFARDRVQFGRPIAEFQAIRFKIAQMATQVEAARQLLYSVCRKIDMGARCDLEAAMVKYHATEMAEAVTSEALQIHGGAGYTTLHAVERYWRDARLTKIFEGTSEIQLRIVSDQLLGKLAS